MHWVFFSFFKSHNPELNKEFELYRYPRCGPDIETYTYRYLRNGSIIASAKKKNNRQISHQLQIRHNMKSNNINFKISLPVSAVLIITFPIECPTKLSLISTKFPDLEALSIFFLRKVITSWANRCPISLKSQDVLSSFASDIRNSALGSTKSHWFRMSRKSRWCPWSIIFLMSLSLSYIIIQYKVHINRLKKLFHHWTGNQLYSSSKNMNDNQ